MFGELLYVAQRAFLRAPGRAFRLASRALAMGSLLLTCVYLAASGFLFSRILAAVAPGTDPLQFFRAHALAAFFLLLIFRLLVQHRGGIDVKPLLPLPVGRRRIAVYRMAGDLANLHTVVPLAIGLPIVFTVAPGPAAWPMALNVAVGALCLGWLVAGGRLAFERQRTAIVALIIAVGGFGLADFLNGQVALTTLSRAVFDPAPRHPWLPAIAPAAALATVAVLYYSLLLSSLYLDVSAIAAPRRTPILIRTRLLDRLAARNIQGVFFGCEWRMVWRQKRTRQGILLGALMGWAYGVLIASGKERQALMDVFSILASFGLGPNFYAAGLFGWEARHFAGLRAWPQHGDDYIRAKLAVLRALTALLALPPLGYYLYRGLGAPALVLFFSSISILPAMLTFGGTFNRSFLDASGGVWMNYQGLSYFKVSGALMMVWLATQVLLRAVLDTQPFVWLNLALCLGFWAASRPIERWLAERFAAVQHQMYSSFVETA